MKTILFPLILIGCSRALLAAGCADQRNFNGYINCTVKNLATSLTVDAAKNAPGKQTEAPSLATNSSSFVDQSSAPDLFGVAFGMTGISSSNQNQGVTVTASAYAVQAAIQRFDPLTPENYIKGVQARKLSFSLGSDVPDDASKPTAGKANVYGFKYIFYGSREPELVHNAERKAMEDSIQGAAADIAKWKLIQDWLFVTLKDKPVPAANPRELADFVANELSDKWLDTYNSLNSGQKEELDRRIKENTINVVQEFKAVKDFVGSVRDAGQWSFEFLNKRRSQDSGNDYRAQLIYDHGVFSGRSLLIFNASADYKDFKKIGGDTRGGRAALEFRNRILGDGLFKSTPLTISFSGEAKWMTRSKPNYSAQGKVVIPLGVAGAELPIAFTYSSQRVPGQTKDLVVHAALAIDPAKILDHFKN